MPTDDHTKPKFKEGDRVQVSEAWFVAELRGATGTIIPAHKGCKDLRSEGAYWVSFDGQVDIQANGAFTDSAEVDADCLRRL
jgi:hypothetical protein